MPTVQEQLAQFLDGATRVAVLAVGSRLRGDDVAGLLAAVHLKRQLAKRGVAAEAHFVPRGNAERTRTRRLAAKEAQAASQGERRMPAVLILNGDTAPENMTGQIKDFKPSHLIILDAADTAREVGSIDLVDPAGLSSNLSASTHSLPIKMVIEYIDHYAPCKCTLAGIQPRSVHFGGAVTRAVSVAGRDLGELLAAALCA